MCGSGLRGNVWQHIKYHDTVVSFLLSVERNQAYFYCLFKGKQI